MSGELRESIGQFLRHDCPLIIHSGFKLLREEFASPEQFVEFVLEHRQGKLTLFPTFTGTATDSATNPPVFDVSSTPCYTGKIPSAALEILGSNRRTLHPTHSWVISGSYDCGVTDWVTPCGPKTPLYDTMIRDGLVLLVGTGLQSLTLIHSAEESAAVPYVLQDQPVTCLITDHHGDERKITTQIHSWTTKRNYPRLQTELVKLGFVIKKPFGMVVDALHTYDHLEERLQDDPSIVLA